MVPAGDVNADGSVDLSDAVSVLGHLFGQGSTYRCPVAADFNQDGTVDIADPIAILNHLFGGHPGPSGEVVCF